MIKAKSSGVSNVFGKCFLLLAFNSGEEASEIKSKLKSKFIQPQADNTVLSIRCDDDTMTNVLEELHLFDDSVNFYSVFTINFK